MLSIAGQQAGPIGLKFCCGHLWTTPVFIDKKWIFFKFFSWALQLVYYKISIFFRKSKSPFSLLRKPVTTSVMLAGQYPLIFQIF